MNRRGPFDCRVAMDPAAFARFCETRSITKCVPGPHTWPGRITVDACGGSVVLEADGYDSQDLQLLPDLYTAAQAGQVDGAAMVERDIPNMRLEAVVFRNGETWTGWSGCFRRAVDIGPYTPHQVEVPGGDRLEMFDVDGTSTTTHRVRWTDKLMHCFCGEGCRETEQLWNAYGCELDDYEDEDYGDDIPVVDIATFMPARVTGQPKQAAGVATAVGNSDGRLTIERLKAVGRLAAGWRAWNAYGAGQQNMLRRWLETFKEATGERHVSWVPDLFDADTAQAAELYGNLNFRPVCANTDVTQGETCPAFLVSATATFDTILVPAHVDNVSLSNAAKLAANGHNPVEAVALIAAITHPDR